jgi:DNA-binding NarL/FixJ family response regulator
MAKPLTARETEVLVLLAKGEPVSAIADAFEIAERSVRAHIQMVIEKVGANDAAHAIAIALHDGLIAR